MRSECVYGKTSRHSRVCPPPLNSEKIGSEIRRTEGVLYFSSAILRCYTKLV